MNYVLVKYSITNEEGTSKVTKILSYEFINTSSDLPGWYRSEIMNDQYHQHEATILNDTYFTLIDWDESKYFENKSSWIFDELLLVLIPHIRNERLDNLVK